MSGTIVLHSGGLDSTVLLYRAVAAFGAERVISLGFDYGQRHGRELNAADAIAEELGVQRVRLSVPALQAIGASVLTDPDSDVPEGHYADENMRQTVVPFRNGVLLALAVSLAEARRFNAVWYAAHFGDHAVYPDCRIPFQQAFDKAARFGTYTGVRVSGQFLRDDKAEIARTAIRLSVPVEQTWSCYKGGAVQCGRCATCFERREAFHLAGHPDPTPYLDDTPFEDLAAEYAAKDEGEESSEDQPCS